MTSPPGGGTPIVPDKGYTAQTIYQLQNVDPDALGAEANLDLWEMLENFRNKLLTDLLGGFASVPIAILDGIGDVISAITGILNGDFDDLHEWAQNVIDGFGNLLDALQGNYTGTDAFLLQIQTWAGDLFAWVQDVADFVQNLLDAILRGIRGIPVVGGAIADVISDLTGLNTKATNALSTANSAAADAAAAQVAINDLSADMAALQVTQVYESLSQHDIVSFPRYTLGLGADGTTGSAGSMSCADASHSHSSHSHSVGHEMPTANPGKGVVGYVPLFVNRFCRPRRLKLITGSTGWSIFSIDYWYVALCVYNPNTGNVEKVWDGGDQKGAITTAAKLHAFDMGTLNDVSPGTILFGAQLQNAGLIVNTRPIAALWQPGLQDPSAELLTAPLYNLSGQSSIPSSVPLSSLTPNNDTLPWMGVGVDPV
ncbi:hypothetical protein SEA_TIAMOCELI_35 [Gordonia phage Tiamoceli]|uniref:Minor tail protein n=1 Tax=Gordonia phage Tiamoceli TaxID=2510508 RepID=A0A411CSG0_9CAUD|nr:minor tail protein [Gordonia phage Tiamoceli]QAY16779.1 hypothetical protein SEA_TIAMOCELI_35 [Gordonia phage Tiamoceli]